MTTREPLLSGKELAAALGRDRTYISAMKKRGFEMPGGRATLREARSFLARNPRPRSRVAVVVVAAAA
jgi:hypothetical protein